MSTKDTITIIGAGLCGSLLALRLAQRGYKVAMYEKRPDLRKTDISSGRSINLALSDRGLNALKLVGLDQKSTPFCIPMYGRLIHDKEGKTFTSNYSGREGEYINSISRQDLNAMLLDEAEIHENVSLHFNVKSTGVDIETTTAHFKSYDTKKEFSVTSTVIFGADGAGSVLRKSYNIENKSSFKDSQEFLSHGYKELEIPANKDGTHKISKDHLHIWPRGAYMLIALPNLNGSFTVTLFLDKKEGKYNFSNLKTTNEITSFFKEQFSDALALIPNIVEEFKNNPTGILGTIKCSPWNHKGKTLLIGDAAHAIVPFYGQGMNASFEDIYVFDKALEAHQGDWEKVFKTYQKLRKQDTDAIADLAIENYYEMRDHVANPLFQEKRKLEMQLEKEYPNTYFSKYSMVTFDETIGYHNAQKKGNAQNKALLDLVENSNINKSTNLKSILEKVQNKTAEILASE